MLRPRTVVPAILTLVLGLALGYSAGGAQSDEANWFKKVNKFRVKNGDHDFRSAKTLCVCSDDPAKPRVGYFIGRVETVGDVHRAMLLCSIPQFDKDTGEFELISSCSDFEVLPG